MRQYTIKRIGLFIPTVLLVTVIVFVVMRLIPGDPALAILSADDAAYTEDEPAPPTYRTGHGPAPGDSVCGLDRGTGSRRLRHFILVGRAGH